jgi:hypothetical protein
MPGQPLKKPQNHNWLKIHPTNWIRLAYWRMRVISANTIGFGEGEKVKPFKKMLIRQDIAY